MSGSANSSWRAVIVLTVVAAVAGLVVFLLQSSNRGAAGRHPAAPATTATGVRSPLDVSAQIAALQQSLRNLEENRRDLFLKLREARNLEKATNGVWLAEIQQARQELEAALDAHPAVVAAKNEMQRILDEQHITDTNSAAVLTRLHQKQNTRETTFKNNISAIWDRGAEERKKAMVEFGKTDMRKLTEAEADRLAKIQERAMAEFHEFGKQNEEQKKTPDEEEQRLKSEFDALRAQINSKSGRYAQLYNDMPALRCSLRTEDPAIAALDQKLTALDARRHAVLNANPDATGILRQIAQLDKQRLEITGKLRLLRMQPGTAATAAASTNNVAQGCGTNG